ncbi:MAG: Stage V sporulation protein E [Berkelbacteria bacterium GW2011_GWA1_36_9]|uniref:Probable peptidoglycan glycosyltransferase FtsW n=1 Tax=Berkelbacteria bacterium GW2011_GWA1_36_9 TaxID=1618331 RepID=A0A0G0FG54_9BACT|nr:MAG: Stage V sporulation protein E [Berkelbacteria bacterium GW2011_GWA1_36_9]
MKRHFNYYLFFLIVFLVGFGFLFLASLSASASLQRFGTTNYFLLHQLFYGLLPAIILGFAAYIIPLNFFKRWAPVLVILNLIALFLVFLPFIGSNFWGATRWIDMGKFTVQPSEFLKITAILYLSAWIASKLSESSGSSWKSGAKKGYHNLIYILVPFSIFLAIISLALFFQKDASTLGIIALTLLVVYFSAKTPLWHTLLVIIAGISSLLFFVKFEQYRLDRWLIFLNPEADPLGKGFQLRQSLISLGSGGIFGEGLGMSTQKFGFLPQAMSDSVFAIIGEELGIIGGTILVALFILFFYLGIKIAKNSNDKFSKLTAIGITFWITLQAFINISSAIGIFPLAGIPLPFFSYGGSHLAAEIIGVGLLLNISKNS